MLLDREKYFSILSSFENIPFEQSQKWIESRCKKGVELLFFVDSLDLPNLACCGELRRSKIRGKVLSVSGLCRKGDATSALITSFFKSVITVDADVISVSDLAEYDVNFEIGIRRAGFIRPFGLSMCPLSLIVDLQAPRSYHRNWKRNVKKSLESGNTFHFIEKPSQEDVRLLHELFLSMNNRKGIDFGDDPVFASKLLENGPFQLFFVNNERGERIAGRVEYLYGSSVYDVWAANSEEAIRTGAAYQIQEGILDYYRDRGFLRFDYGRIPPCDGPRDNIYLSKSYSGGRPVSYNGEWYRAKSAWKTGLYSIYRYCYKKLPLY